MNGDAPWQLVGADGEAIIGNTHEPSPADGPAQGVVVIAHGFKGYKDYGMLPRVAAHAAGAGFIAHRFNFSHSGMTNDTETFARADLFERDTWNRQVFDLRRVVESIAAGELAGSGLPFVLFGHSRGGVATLLAAGRYADDDSIPAPAGLVLAAAPSGCRRGMSDEQAATLLEQGWLPSPSARTGQLLRVGRAFLQEQIDDPAAHDLLALARRLHCPALVLHGADDATVPSSSAHEIGDAIGPSAEVWIVPRGDHVFNTPNPMPPGTPSPQLQCLLTGLTSFARRVCGCGGN